MTAGFVFPSKPKINQIFQAPNNVSYIWTGTRWELRNTVGGTPTLPPPPPSLVGPTGPTGPAGPNYLKMDANGQINMSLIPAVGNTFSLGSSTNWWKDLWLSANTLYIGGTSISTTGGKLTIPNLSIPSYTVSYGTENNTATDTFYDTAYGGGIMMVVDLSADFLSLVKQLKPGDSYIGKQIDLYGNTVGFPVDRVFTLYQKPDIIDLGPGNNRVDFYLIENDYDYIGKYSLLTFPKSGTLTIGNMPIQSSGGSIVIPNLSIPSSTVSYGPENNTIQYISYDTMSTYGVFSVENSSIDFRNLAKQLKPGDTFIAKHIGWNGNTVGFPVDRVCTVYQKPDVVESGFAPPGFFGPGFTDSVIIPVYENTTDLWGNYSLLTFPKSGTLTIGNMPIQSSSQSLVIPNLNVSGTLTSTGTGINPQDTQTPVRFLYNFNLTDHFYYAGFAGIANAPSGQINITDNSAWPPPSGNYQTNGGGYLFSFCVSGTDNDNNNISSYLTKLSNGDQDWNRKGMFMIMKDAKDSSKYTIFCARTVTFSANFLTYQFTCQYITGTVGHSYFVNKSSNNKVLVELEFSNTTMGGKIPLNASQHYYWRDSSLGVGVCFASEGYPELGNASSRALPLACNTLELHAGSSNPADLGQIILANTAEYNGRTLNVIVRGNSIAKSSFVNVSGAALSSTITANTMFTALFTTTSGQWNVTNIVTNV